MQLLADLLTPFIIPGQSIKTAYWLISDEQMGPWFMGRPRTQLIPIDGPTAIFSHLPYSSRAMGPERDFSLCFIHDLVDTSQYVCLVRDNCKTFTIFMERGGWRSGLPYPVIYFHFVVSSFTIVITHASYINMKPDRYSCNIANTRINQASCVALPSHIFKGKRCTSSDWLKCHICGIMGNRKCCFKLMQCFYGVAVIWPEAFVCRRTIDTKRSRGHYWTTV